MTMGTVYRKAYTMPLPAGAEIVGRDGGQVARWRLRNGSARSAQMVPGESDDVRVRGRSAFYTAKYRAANGQIVEVSTGCRDETAARAVLAQLERRAELVKAGVLTDAEDEAANHASVPLARHFDAYEKHLQVKGCVTQRVGMVRQRLERLAAECGFARLNRMSAGAVEKWLVQQQDAGMSAAARNNYREAAVCFGNWCRRTRRLTENPFADVPRADAQCDRRHQRRALSEAEIVRLLKVAALRPLAEYGREFMARPADGPRAPKSRATWSRSPLTIQTIDAAVARAREALKDNPAFIAELERVGRERALMYRTLVLTGLRKGELASLTVGQLDSGGPVAYVILEAKDEKNRQGSEIPLRADLAAETEAWIAQRLADLQADCRRRGMPVPSRLSASTPLFRVPSGLTRILDRDLAAAGIPKRDERNRVIDVHALRTTFGTHLCAAGVPLRTAQAAMRHSKPELTANVYTDPKLLDIAGAVEALPRFAAADGGAIEHAVRATGTEGAATAAANAARGRVPQRASGRRTFPTERGGAGKTPGHLAPNLAPTADRSGQPESPAGNATAVLAGPRPDEPVAASDAPVKTCPPLSSRDNGGHEKRVMGLEPTTLTLATSRPAVLSRVVTRVTAPRESPLTSPSPSSTCVGDDPVRAAAKAFLALTPDERARLALLLMAESLPAEGP